MVLLRGGGRERNRFGYEGQHISCSANTRNASVDGHVIFEFRSKNPL